MTDDGTRFIPDDVSDNILIVIEDIACDGVTVFCTDTTDVSSCDVAVIVFTG